jgi:hypothetical protein
MSNGNGHRWSKFWWQDWKNDDALLGCSLAARGLWMAMLCIAHDADPCGHVLINGSPPSPRDLAMRLGNTTTKEVAKLLAELEQAKVFSRADDGTIYSRRMVKDAALSEGGREAAGRRWNGHQPNGSPNGSPIQKPNGIPNAKPYALEAESEAEEERTPPYPPRERGGARRVAKPLFRNGALQLIAEEGFPSLRETEHEASQLSAFLAIAGGGYGTR